MKTTLCPEPMDYSEPEYPYGLKVTLEQQELDKLDMDISDYSVEDTITAKVHLEVISINGEPHENLGLQITHIDMD